MFSLNSAGVPLPSQLPGGQRRVFICTRISRQSSRTFYRSHSSTSGICSGNAPPLCPCRGCSLCHSTSSRSCHSHWKSCCIVWKKENAVSECKFLQGFPNHCPVVLLGLTALQGTGWIQHSEHQANSPLRLQGWQEKPHITLQGWQGCTHITCYDTQNNIKLLFCLSVWAWQHSGCLSAGPGYSCTRRQAKQLGYLHKKN